MQSSISYDVYIKGLVEKVVNVNVIHDVDNFKTFILFMFLVTIHSTFSWTQQLMYSISTVILVVFDWIFYGMTELQ